MKLTKQLLIKKYKINKKPLKQIAEETNHSPSTIWRNLKRLNIKIRNKSEAHADISGNKNPSKKLEVRLKISESKKGHKRPDLSKINSKRIGNKNGNYIDGRYTEIHHCKNCNKKISYWSWFYGSGLCRSCSAGGTGIPGENSEYGAEFDNALKEQVRFRDGYKCRECGCSQLENGKQLDCHHIDYNKENSILNNLISLCMGCHRRTNTNRKYWTKYFQKYMEESCDTI